MLRLTYTGCLPINVTNFKGCSTPQKHKISKIGYFSLKLSYLLNYWLYNKSKHTVPSRTHNHARVKTKKCQKLFKVAIFLPHTSLDHIHLKEIRTLYSYVIEIC